MHRQVNWQDGEGPISRAVVGDVEQALRVRFPEAFVQVAMADNGATPWPSAVLVLDEIRVFGGLLRLGPPEGEEGDFENLLDVYTEMQDQLSPNLIPFGEDPAGNYFCFDYRQRSTEPAVVFWDHEVAAEADPTGQDPGLMEVAPSFEAFLQRLFDPDREMPPSDD